MAATRQEQSLMKQAQWFGAALLAAFVLGAPAASAQVSAKVVGVAEDGDKVKGPVIYNGFEMVDEQLGVLVGEQPLQDNKASIAVTTDGGKTWRLSRGLSKGRLYGVTFVDKNSGWTVGEGGMILATVDGGKTWQPQTSKVVVDLRGVSFVTPRKGWAVGANSTVVTTADGGRTWQVLAGGQASGEVGEGELILMGCHFVNETTGFVVGAGQNGQIRQTTDGGKTWKTVHTAEDGLFGIQFVDTNNGWAVGAFGTLIATKDGGKTWAAQDSAGEDDLFTVGASDPNRAWLGGQLGALSYTTNGGKKWTSVSPQVIVGGKQKKLSERVVGVSVKGSLAYVSTDLGRIFQMTAQ